MVNPTSAQVRTELAVLAYPTRRPHIRPNTVIVVVIAIGVVVTAIKQYNCTTEDVQVCRVALDENTDAAVALPQPENFSVGDAEF